MSLPIKKILVSSLVCSLLLNPFLPTSSHAAVIGGVCSKRNNTATINKVKVICQQKGKKLIWVAVIKSSSTISQKPQNMQNLPKIATPGKLYTAGKDLEPGYYVQEQNSINNSCVSNITHYLDAKIYGKNHILNGDFDTMLENIGTLSHAYITIKVELGDELEVYNCDATYILGFSNTFTPISYPIYYGGIYIVGVNIAPGSYLVSGFKSEGCVYSYSIASDPLKLSLLYGNSIMPRRLVTDKDNIATIPVGSLAVLFDNGCGEIIKVS